MSTVPEEYRPLLHRAVARYVQLPPTDAAAFEGVLQHATLEKGEYLVREGAVCTTVAFICRGVLRYYYLNDGQEHIGHIALEGEFLSAYSSFVTGWPSMQSVDALEPSEILTFTKPDLDRLYQSSASFERFGRKIAEEIIVGSQNRTAMLLFQSAAERYEWLVRHRAGLLARVPQYMLASYIGITPQSLSRLRRQRSSSS